MEGVRSWRCDEKWDVEREVDGVLSVRLFLPSTSLSRKSAFACITVQLSPDSHVHPFLSCLMIFRRYSYHEHELLQFSFSRLFSSFEKIPDCETSVVFMHPFSS